MRDLFLKDWAWKLFSLFLAAAIWLTVHRIIEPEAATLAGLAATQTYENLAVHPVSSSADVSLYHMVPPTVGVTVSGPPEIMSQLQSSQIRAVVDLTGGLTSGGQVSVEVPPEVTIIKIDPPVVTVISPSKH